MINTYDGKYHGDEKPEDKDKSKLYVDNIAIIAVFRSHKEDENSTNHKGSSELNHDGFPSFNFVNDDHQRIVSSQICDIQDSVGSIDIESELSNDESRSIVH